MKPIRENPETRGLYRRTIEADDQRVRDQRAMYENWVTTPRGQTPSGLRNEGRLDIHGRPEGASIDAQLKAIVANTDLLRQLVSAFT